MVTTKKKAPAALETKPKKRYPPRAFLPEELPEVYFRRNFYLDGTPAKPPKPAMTYDDLGDLYRCDWYDVSVAVVEATILVREGKIIRLPNGRFDLSPRKKAELAQERSLEDAKKLAEAAKAREEARRELERRREQAMLIAQQKKEERKKAAMRGLRWLNSDETGDLLGLDRCTVLGWVKKGYFRPDETMVFERRVYFLAEAVEAYASGQRKRQRKPYSRRRVPE